MIRVQTERQQPQSSGRCGRVKCLTLISTIRLPHADNELNVNASRQGKGARCKNATKVLYGANNENKGQTVSQDLKLTPFRKLMSLNTAYDRKITTIQMWR